MINHTIESNVSYYLEHCVLTGWQDWAFPRNVVGIPCGEGVRKRDIKTRADHGGNSCEKQYNCTTKCYEETKEVDCPGIIQLW